MTVAMVGAAAWIAGLAVGVVALPLRPALGFCALAAAAAFTGLLLLVRPVWVPLALVAALAGLARAELPAHERAPASLAAAYSGTSVLAVGRLVDDPRPAGTGSDAILEPELVRSRQGDLPPLGNLLLRVKVPTDALAGDEVQAYGGLGLPRDLPGFDRRAYLALKGAYLQLNTQRLEIVHPAGDLAAAPAWLRQHFRSAAGQFLPAPHAALLVGIVLGIRSGIPADLNRDLVATGLVHLLVLSGLKVAVFARMLGSLLQPLLGRGAMWVMLPLIGCYALVGGSTPAAVRAAAMGGLAMLGTRLGRPAHVWTSLGVVGAVMLGWHPDLVWDTGFQLSFLGTAAIILLTPPIEGRLRWIPRPLREPFAVTCAAQVGTLPLMATDFHLLSPVAPLANALVLPLLPAMVVAGSALSLAPLAPPIGAAFSLPISGLLAYLEQVAAILGRVPAAAIPVPDFPVSAGLAYYGGLASLLAVLRLRPDRRLLAAGMAIGVPLLVGFSELAAWTHSPATATVLAVGQGQAVLFTGPGSLLIDGGPSPQVLEAELGRRLPPWQRDLDGLAITSPSLGHVGGLLDIHHRFGTVFVSGADLPGVGWRSVVLGQVGGGARLVELRAGRSLGAAGYRLQVLAPEASDPHDQSGVGYLALRVVGPSGRSFCDLSDLDPEAQSAAASHLDGPCDYLLLPSAGTTGLAPEAVSRSGHPHLIVSTGGGRLARDLSHVLVTRTDQEGSIDLPM